MSDKDKKKKKKQQQEDWLEAQIMAFLQRSLKTALDEAMKELFKDFP